MGGVCTVHERTETHTDLDSNGVTNLNCIMKKRPPLWSSGESSWLQIERSGFDCWCYQISGTGPLSLVSTTEELRA
jgi:hypothetical protein